MITETETHDQTAPSVLESAWRFRTVVLICVGVFALLGLLYGAVTSADASATARLVLRDPTGADLSFPVRPVSGDYERFVRAQARFAASDIVLVRAGESLGISLDEIGDRVSTRAGSDDDVLVIIVSGTDAGDASDLAIAVVDAYRAARAEVIVTDAQRFLADVDNESLLATGDTADKLDATAADHRLAVDAYGDGVAFIEHIEVDESSTAVGIGLPFIGGGLLGLVLGLITAWVLADRNPRIEHADDVAIRHGVTLVGRVPRLAPGGAQESQRSANPSRQPWHRTRPEPAAAPQRPVVHHVALPAGPRCPIEEWPMARCHQSQVESITQGRQSRQQRPIGAECVDRGRQHEQARARRTRRLGSHGLPIGGDADALRTRGSAQTTPNGDGEPIVDLVLAAQAIDRLE